MSESEQTGFVKLLVLVNGGVPAAVLAWDAARGQLGPNATAYALHTTGMLSLIFLGLTIAVTPLRHWTGWSSLIAGRRTLGLYAFAYALAHFAVYVVFDRAGSASSTFEELSLRPYLQVGMFALCVMIPLAVTSTQAMVKRLGAQRWKLLHRLTYAAAVCGAIHYFMLVKADIRLPLAFIGSFALLLGWRGGRSLLSVNSRSFRSHRNKSYEDAVRPPWKGLLKVEAITDETPDIRTFHLVTSEPHEPTGSSELPFRFLPGQFMTVHVVIDGKRHSRSYTIASGTAQRDRCSISVKKLPHGTVSTFMHELVQVGHSLLVTAPLGRFVFDGRGEEGVTLIAGGVGITPLMSMIRSLLDADWRGKIRLLVAVKSRADAAFASELKVLAARHANLTYRFLLTRETLEQASTQGPWDGGIGRIDRRVIQDFVPDVEHHPAFVCGPDEMMRDVCLMLSECGVPSSRIQTEAFASPRASNNTAERSASVAGSMLRLEWKSAGLVIAADADRTVLEAIEEAGHSMPFECRAGVCGQCRCRLLDGEVSMDADEALDEQEKADGWILACQSRPQSDLIIE